MDFKLIVITVFIVVSCLDALSSSNFNFETMAIRRVKRIVQGVDVSESDFPFILSLRYTESQQHFCGATRLAENWIITAAHCVTNLKPHHLYASTTDNQFLFIDEILQNHFNPVNFMNDIALLKVKPHSEKGYINTAVLPNGNYVPESECIILGYGSQVYTGLNSNSLKMGTLNILTYNDCLSKLGHVTTPDVYTGMFCAGSEGVDACNGDSGGPMMCTNSNGQLELTGIISYGVGCGTPGVPGVYTGVYHHLKWIEYYVFGTY